GSEPPDQLADGGARLRDLVAFHRARAVEDDDQVGRPAGDRRLLDVGRGAHDELHANEAVAAAEHRGTVQVAGERDPAVPRGDDGRRMARLRWSVAEAPGPREGGGAEECAGDGESSTS